MAPRSIALKSHPAKTVSRRPKAKQPRVIDIKKRSVPINVRQSGNSEARMLISTRVRKNPYWHLSQQEGCWAYTVYNHMYHPRAYISMMQGGLMKEYEYLTKHVTMWNVAVERQIQVKGPDAADFVNKLITRDVHKKLPVNMCRYVILCNQDGGIINDPVLLRVAEDEFWFSISDSDVLLWAQGVNATASYNVTIKEIDVSPVQIQGPKSVKPDDQAVRTPGAQHPLLRSDARQARTPERRDLRAPGSPARSATRSTCMMPYAMPTRCGTRSRKRARHSTCG